MTVWIVVEDYLEEQVIHAVFADSEGADGLFNRLIEGYMEDEMLEFGPPEGHGTITTGPRTKTWLCDDDMIQISIIKFEVQ